MAQKNYKTKIMNPEKIKYSNSVWCFNKKGSSLILTLVVISLIAIISTLALALSLNAYKASVQNKWADEDFYYCEECVNDIYGILVAETNDIFLENYKQVLSLFTTETPDLINEAFREGVKRSFELNFGSNENSLIIALNRHNVEATDNEGNVIGELNVTFDSNYLDEERYVFKDVCVEFKNSSRSGESRKFYASITTDLIIDIPNLVPSIRNDGEGSLEYVFVSGRDLKFGGEASITGNIYAGNNLVVDSTAKNVNLFSDYITVCNQLENNGKLLVSGSSTSANIWCKDIVLNNNGSFTAISGNMFVNDNLQINGQNCTVQLSGKYYGYADGSKETYYDEYKSMSIPTSSAILVNGQGTRLDMTGIEELLIRGHSFFPLDSNGENYSGSESLATIVSQSMYMVDAKYIKEDHNKVTIGSKSIGFEDIIFDGQTLEELLDKGYILVTGGVNIAEVSDITGITEGTFASGYLSNTEIKDNEEKVVGYDIVRLKCFDNKYCCLYWNFNSYDTLKDLGSDVVSSEYIADLGAGANITVGNNKIINFNSIKVYYGDKQLEINDDAITAETIFNAPVDGSNPNAEQTYQLVDSLDNKYNFNYVSGKKLPNDMLSSLSNYLNDSEPVRAVVVSTKSDTNDVYNYELRFYWNFDSEKFKDQGSGDKFISACIEAGLINGFLENFMDGGYIKISGDANVSTKADLYEYIADADGYIAQKYGDFTNSLFDSPFFAKNFSDSYKWYRTTLTPKKYDPIKALLPFGDDHKISSKYSLFERQSSCYNNSTKKVEEVRYIDFSEINGISGYNEISADNYKILIVNGDLEIINGVWTSGGSIIYQGVDAFHGMIFVNGNVRIDSDIKFRGMIISDGEVNVSKGDFVYDVDIVEECLENIKNTSATEAHRWETLVSDEFYTRKSVEITGSSSLNAVDCIRYENWTRNRDK